MKTAEINWTQGKHGGLYITGDGARLSCPYLQQKKVNNIQRNKKI